MTMHRNGISFYLAFIIMLVIWPGYEEASAKKWTIKVKDYSFFPYNITHVKARDTIQWVWESGFHSTTSTSIPPDALDWDYPIDSIERVAIYIPRVNGTYFYHSLPDTASGMDGHFVVYGANGLGEEGQVGFRIFPNPGSGVVAVWTPVDCAGPATMEVYDCRGVRVHYDQILLKNNRENHYFNLGNLPRGVYIFRLSATGQRTYTQRVVRM